MMDCQHWAYRPRRKRALVVACTWISALVAVEVHAQGRLEIDVAVGSQTYLNDLEPDPEVNRAQIAVAQI